MKLWLLDADVIIDLLGLNIFEKLVEIHQVHAASEVIKEVKHFHSAGKKVLVNFRHDYVETGRVKELSAKAEELKKVIEVLPELKATALILASMSLLPFSCVKKI